MDLQKIGFSIVASCAILLSVGCTQPMEGTDAMPFVLDIDDAPTHIVTSTSSSCQVSKDLGVDVRLYFDPSFSLPHEPVLRGCEQAWGDLDVRCSVVEDPRDANLTVLERPCNLDSMVGGGLTHVSDTPTPTSITFFPGCWVIGHYHGRPTTFFGEEPYLSIETQIIAAHEIGHALGIAPHTPIACTGNEEVDPEFGPLCGHANMNAGGDLHTETYPRLPDLAAFKRRNVASSEGFLGEPQRLCLVP